MSELLARLQGDLNSARKSQDKAGTLLLSTVLSEVKNKKIELRRDPADADVIDVLRKSIKRRRESIEMYTKGNRKDLADKESAEATALEKYLPAQGSDRRRCQPDRSSNGKSSSPVQRSGRWQHHQRHRSRGAEQAGVKMRRRF